MMRIRPLYNNLLMGVVLFFLCPGASHAQTEDKAGFAVSMGSQLLNGRPGTTVEGSLSIVATRTNKITRYEVTAVDLGQTSEGSVRTAESGRGARSCAEWIRLPGQLEIPAGGGTRSVSFSIPIPADAKGAYYAFIKVSLIPSRPGSEQMAMLIQPTLSVRVELEITGLKEITLSVTDLSFVHDLGDGHPGMFVDVTNDGNIKTTFEGDVLLYGSKRRFPYRGVIPPDANGQPALIYPGISRRLRCPLAEAPPAGDYRAEVRLRMAGRWRTRSTFDIVVPSRGSSVTQPAVSLTKSEFDIDVGVEPRHVEVVLPPGATRSVSIRVHNRDTVEVHAKATVASVIQEPSGFLTYADLADTAERWVEITPAEWTLGPNSARSVLLNITAPDYGGKASALCAVRIIATAGVDQADWLSAADLGIPVIAVPPGASPPDLEISKLEVIRVAPELNPRAAILIVENIGGRTAELKGKVILERLATGQLIQTMVFSQVDGLILAPGVAREFRIPLPYLDKDEFLLKAELSIAGKAKTVKSAETTFVCTRGPG